jgi:hypothetical protein
MSGRPEAFSAEAKRSPGKGLDRHAPGYLLAESASVILKRVRTRDPALRLTRDEGRIVLTALQTSPIQFHEFRPLIELSFALAEEIGASLYDGLFLAFPPTRRAARDRRREAVQEDPGQPICRPRPVGRSCPLNHNGRIVSRKVGIILTSSRHPNITAIIGHSRP